MEGKTSKSHLLEQQNFYDQPMNICRSIDLRSSGFLKNSKMHKNLLYSSCLVDRMQLVGSLESHEGCVNCISWSEDGDFLLSGSDDTTICIWDYRGESLHHRFDSGHSRNIFGVKFLPETQNQVIVSGAMDCEVRVHTAPFSSNVESTTCYQCHAGRVKELAVEIGNPHLFWSAAEDGTVRQWDRRLPHCGATALGATGQPPPARNGNGHSPLPAVLGAGVPGYLSTNCLVNLGRCPVGQSSLGGHPLFGERPGRAMSLALNPVLPYQLAVAAGDHLTRLYDRRMLSLSQPSLEPTPSVASFHPIHSGHSPNTPTHATCVRFSPSGQRLLVSYHNDHIYMFDPHRTTQAMSAYGIPPLSNFKDHSSAKKGTGESDRMDLEELTRSRVHWGSMEYWAIRGYEAMQTQRSHTKAIDYFSDSVLSAYSLGRTARVRRGRMAQVLCWRAECLMQRRWRGDLWLALKDAAHAQLLCPDDPLPHLRSIQALFYLRRRRQCQKEVLIFQSKFPISAQLAEPYSSFNSTNHTRSTQNGRARRGASHSKTSRARRQEQQRGGARSPNSEQHTKSIEAHQLSSNNVLSYSNSHHSDDLPPLVAASDESNSDGSITSEQRVFLEETAMENAEQTTSHLPSSELQATSAERSDPDPPQTLATEFRERWVRRLGNVRRFSSGAASSESEHDGDRSGEGSGTGEEHSESGPCSDRMDRSCGRSGDGDGSDAADDEDSEAELDLDIFLDPELSDIAENLPALRKSNDGPIPPCTRILQRYVGACNVQTDIKEADFFGLNEKYIIAGSDDGRAFIWEQASGRLVNCFEADEDILNCVQSHPYDPVLATSGIESVVKLWAPLADTAEPRIKQSDMEDIIEENQKQMSTGPWSLINQPLMRQILVHMSNQNNQEGSNSAEICIQS